MVPATGDDWPQWGARNTRNMISDEKGLPESFAPGQKDARSGNIDPATARNVKWGVRVGANTLSTPAVAGGKVFLGTCDDREGIFKCLDARTGRPLWQYTAPHRKVPRKIDGDWPFNFSIFAPMLGICSSPAVDGSRVYFVNHRCEVVCVDIAASCAMASAVRPSGPDGPGGPSGQPPAAKVAWVFDMWDQTGVRPSDACDGSPLIDGDLLYVCTSNGVDREASVAYADNRKTPAPDAPNLIVLDKNTGRLAATDDARHIGPNMLHGQWSSPSMGVVNGKKLVFFGGGDGVCYAFEALAAVPEELLSKEMGTGTSPHAISRGDNGLDSEPVPISLQPRKLRTVWSFDCNPPEYKSFGGLDWATHYSLGDRRLRKSLNKKDDGSFVGMSEIIGTPVFHQNRVYVAIGRDPEHGRGRGALWCIDASKTGDITRSGRVWSYQGLDRTLSTASIAGGLLYIADVAGRLHCLDADSGECRWVYETKATTWGSTLVADGKVYLPTQKYLYVLAAGKELRLLDKINLGSAMWASPVVAEGVLYVTSTRYLWAVGKAK
jgi:outer membrane protein assembly factor BamB